MKSRWYKLAGVLISALFLYLAVRKVDFAESVRILTTAQVGWLLVSTLIYLSSFPVRALRWRRILRDQKALPLKETVVPVLLGHMANHLLPARAGEIYRAHVLGRRARMSRSGVVGSIVIERTFDGLTLLALILLLFFLLPETQFLGVAALTTGLFFLALAAGILIYSSAVDRTHRAIDKALGTLPQKLREFADRRLTFFLKGIRGISTVRGCLETAGYTALIWTLEISAVALVIISFGVALPLSGYLLVYALATLGTTLPSGPAYIGQYQYAFVLALSFFSISQETALAISVAAQLTLLGSVTVIGLVLFGREQLYAGPPLDQESWNRKGESSQNGT